MNSRLRIVGEAPESGEAHRHGACGTGRVELNVTPIAGSAIAAPQYRGRAALVTLGCAKNQVDSEVMAGVLRTRGFEMVSDLATADVAVVNTCGFLESAVRESVDAILEVAEHKREGRLRKLIVAGCAVSRYGESLAKELPEVDAFLTTEEILRVGEVAEGNSRLSEILTEGARPYFLYDESTPRSVATNGSSAYVKISEGCNRPCAFCIIPRIRGGMRSRRIPSVVREIELLGAQGIREVNLIGQDLTDFGSDHGEGDIVALLREIDRARAVSWVRLLYAYPLGVNERVVNTIMELPTLCKYLDFPLQHASEEVLRRMRRPLGKYSPRPLVESIRRWAPELALRTTFIVGFPGEREEDVDELVRFVEEGHFSNVGVFCYSREEGTAAAALDNQISDEVKEARRSRVMEAQQRVVTERLDVLKGARYTVLVEGPHEETELLTVGRTQHQAPEVDGITIINEVAEGVFSNQGEDEAPILRAGSFVEVEITESAGYDLIGRVVASEDARAEGTRMGVVPSGSEGVPEFIAVKV